MAARRSDTDEDVALVDVDNAAVGSMFSPNMWVRRPSRIDPKEMQDAAATLANENPVENPTYVSNQDRDDGSQPLKDTSNMMQQQPRRNNGKRSAEADLDILDALDKEGTEQEQTEQDLLHIAQLEAELLRAKDQCHVLERRLQEVSAYASDVIHQNQGIKRFFAAIIVARDDFNYEGIVDEPERKRKMISTGNRLIDNLQGGPTNAAATGGDGSLTAAVVEGFRGSGNSKRASLNGATPAPYMAQNEPAMTPLADYPAECQIASAALIAANWNPAIAILALVDKSLEGKEPPQQQQQHQGHRISQHLQGPVAAVGH